MSGEVSEKNDATDHLLTRIRQHGWPEPEREVRFHPSRRWRLDLAWPGLSLAVEVHGGVYARGRHTRGKGFERDREKMNEAQLSGWIVLEFSTGQIKSDACLDQLKRALEGR